MKSLPERLAIVIAALRSLLPEVMEGAPTGPVNPTALFEPRSPGVMVPKKGAFYLTNYAGHLMEAFWDMGTENMRVLRTQHSRNVKLLEALVAAGFAPIQLTANSSQGSEIRALAPLGLQGNAKAGHQLRLACMEFLYEGGVRSGIPWGLWQACQELYPDITEGINAEHRCRWPDDLM